MLNSGDIKTMGPSNLQNFENASPIETQSFIQGPPI